MRFQLSCWGLMKAVKEKHWLFQVVKILPTDAKCVPLARQQVFATHWWLCKFYPSYWNVLKKQSTDTTLGFKGVEEKLQTKIVCLPFACVFLPCPPNLFSPPSHTRTRSSGLSEWRPCTVSPCCLLYLATVRPHHIFPPLHLISPPLSRSTCGSLGLLFFLMRLIPKSFHRTPWHAQRGVYVLFSLEIKREEEGGRGGLHTESTPGAECVLYVFCQWNGCRVSFTILGCFSSNGAVAKHGDGQLEIFTFSSGGVLSSFPFFNVYFPPPPLSLPPPNTFLSCQPVAEFERTNEWMNLNILFLISLHPSRPSLCPKASTSIVNLSLWWHMLGDPEDVTWLNSHTVGTLCVCVCVCVLCVRLCFGHGYTNFTSVTGDNRPQS